MHPNKVDFLFGRLKNHLAPAQRPSQQSNKSWMGKNEDNSNGRDSDSRSRRRRRVNAQKSARENESNTRYINGSRDLANGPSTTTVSNERDARKDVGGEASFRPAKTFEGGDDFIPLELAGGEAGFVWRGDKGKERATIEEESSYRHRKGKEKDAGIEDGEVSDSSRSKHRTNRTSEREWKRHSRHEDERRRERSDYDWDRDRKRKYDEYEGDDRYRAKRQRMEDKKYPWMSGLDLERYRNVAEILHAEVGAFVDWVCPTPAEDEVRGLVVEHITRIIKASFRDAQVFPFGSYQTKLYLPTGDIDLVVLSNTMEHADKKTVLQILARTFKSSGIASNVTIIAKARVPIIKFTSTHGQFKVDISINQDSGLVSGKIINGFLNDMVPTTGGKQSKALRSLIMITKTFLSDRNLNEVYTGGLGSYGIVCLAVSFLQMHPKIRRGEIDPEQNLGVLLIEFFELYGKRFNYDKVGISLRDGGTYFSKQMRGWPADYKRNTLSIEDPADYFNDISSGSYHFHKVRAAFAGAFGILTSTAYSRAPLLSSRNRGHSRLRREDLSVLSSLISVTQETIDHRRSVQKLYNKRVLHDIVGVKSQIATAQDTKLDYPPSSSSNAKNSQVVELAWAGATGSGGSDHEDYRSSSKRRRHDDERGRYDIGRQPSKKRRRMEDPRTLYIADEDESRGRSEVEPADGEPEEYHTGRSREDRSSRPVSGERGKKREYWLAKAPLEELRMIHDKDDELRATG